MEMQIFKSTEFGELGIVEIEGKEYFPATACAKMLGYTNPKKAIIDHCKGVTKRSLPTNGGVQEINLIPEGDLYRLIVSSRLPATERFERWIFDEVVPTIRKQGAYIPDMTAIIAQTVQGVVKELMPYLNNHDDLTPEVHKRTRLKKAPGIVESLDAGYREEIDDMILSNRYTYAQIAAYFNQTYDIQFSRSALARYAKQLLQQFVK